MTLKDTLAKNQLELALLHFLKEGDKYGYELSQQIKEKSGGLLSSNSAAIYTALYKLTEAGYITSYEKLTGKKMTRVYYHIEPAGVEYYERVFAEFMVLQKALFAIFDQTL